MAISLVQAVAKIIRSSDRPSSGCGACLLINATDEGGAQTCR
jgi:hypothetical protein